jgi:ketosteroid isomerase-like protein
LSIETEILKISAAWDAALVANDADAVASYMSDDWVYIDPQGITKKSDLIGWIATGRLAHHTMQIGGTARMAVHGDTVIVTARTASSGVWDGESYTADEWITEIYVRQSERWLCVLSHKCPAAMGDG